MRIVTCLAAVLLITSQAANATAESPIAGPSANNSQAIALSMSLDETERLEEAARDRIATGKAVALLGVAGVAGGLVLTSLGGKEAKESDELLAGFGKQVGGTLLVLAGAGVSIGGVALIASGQSRLAKAKKRRTSLAIAPNAHGGVTAMVSGRF